MRRITRDKISIILIVISVVIISVTFSKKCSRFSTVNFNEENPELQVKEPEYLFGVCIDSLNVTSAEIASGETLSDILDRYGVSAVKIDEIVKKSKGIFDLRGIRQGNRYTVFTTMDSLQKIQYFVYEQNLKDYLVIDFRDTIQLRKQAKEVVTKRRMGEAEIESSLWNAAVAGGMNGALAMNLADVYQWTIDFYGIQKGDKFKVIYDELFVDDKSIGVGTIWGAWFEHGGKSYYAIRYEYNDGKKIEKGYWDEEGKSLKSAFLKAPLKYTRISSKFTNSRLHPILRIRRPHYGVDYAAPMGTPVQAIANGTVIQKSYDRASGNMLKIKHAHGYVSGYLHLKGYAKNIKVGSVVQQGDLIAYVGSTGSSTGPHLDFRIWKNGTPIDPLKMVGEKGEDIAAKYRADYNRVKDAVIAELNGAPYIPWDILNVDSSAAPSVSPVSAGN